MGFKMKDAVGYAKNAANDVANQAKSAINEASSLKAGNVIQGLMGNLNEMSNDEMMKNYSMYLMADETISVGFKLVRDVLIFTDKRLLLFDKQGVTGIKMSVKSINLFSIVAVSMETSGFGFDDCELYFTYIKTPNLKAFNIEYETHKLEFPRKYPVQGLYVLLQQIAYENCIKINNNPNII